MISLFEEPGKSIKVQSKGERTVIPVGKRRYIEFNQSYDEVIALFSNATSL
jgi:hypothetical protein